MRISHLEQAYILCSKIVPPSRIKGPQGSIQKPAIREHIAPGQAALWLPTGSDKPFLRQRRGLAERKWRGLRVLSHHRDHGALRLRPRQGCLAAARVGAVWADLKNTERPRPTVPYCGEPLCHEPRGSEIYRKELSNR